MATSTTPGIWEVQDTTLTMPARLTDACVAGALFRADRTSVDTALEAKGYRDVGVHGRGLAVLVFLQYREFVLGAYDELALGVVAIGPDRRPGLVTLELPVTSDFSREAGVDIWGMPKWLAQSTTELKPGQARVQLHDEAGGAIIDATITAKLRLPGSAPLIAQNISFTNEGTRAGQLLRGAGRMTMRGVRVGRSAHIEWGDHRMGDLGRSLGLSRKPLMSFTAEHMQGVLAEPVEVGH